MIFDKVFTIIIAIIVGVGVLRVKKVAASQEGNDTCVNFEQAVDFCHDIIKFVSPNANMMDFMFPQGLELVVEEHRSSSFFLPLLLFKPNQLIADNMITRKDLVIALDKIFDGIFKTKVRTIAGWAMTESLKYHLQDDHHILITIIDALVKETKIYDIRLLFSWPNFENLFWEHLYFKIKSFNPLSHPIDEFLDEAELKIDPSPRHYSSFMGAITQLGNYSQFVGWLKGIFDTSAVEELKPETILNLRQILSNIQYRSLFKTPTEIPASERLNVCIKVVDFLKAFGSFCHINPLEFFTYNQLAEIFQIDNANAILALLHFGRWAILKGILLNHRKGIREQIIVYLSTIELPISHVSFERVARIPIPNEWTDRLLDDFGQNFWLINNQLLVDGNVDALITQLHDHNFKSQLWSELFLLEPQKMIDALANYPGFERLTLKSFRTYDTFIKAAQEIYQTMRVNDKIMIIQGIIPPFLPQRLQKEEALKLELWPEIYINRLYDLILYPKNRFIIERLLAHPLIREDPIEFLCSPCVNMKKWLLKTLHKVTSPLALPMEHLRFIITSEQFFYSQQQHRLDRNYENWARLLEHTYEPIKEILENNSNTETFPILIRNFALQIGIPVVKYYNYMSIESRLGSAREFLASLVYNFGNAIHEKWLQGRQYLLCMSHLWSLIRHISPSPSSSLSESDIVYMEKMSPYLDFLAFVPYDEMSLNFTSDFILGHLLSKKFNPTLFEKICLKALPDMPSMVSAYIDRIEDEALSWPKISVVIEKHLTSHGFWKSYVLEICHLLGFVCPLSSLNTIKTIQDLQNNMENFNFRKANLQYLKPINRRLFELLYSQPLLTLIVFSDNSDIDIKLLTEEMVAKRYAHYLKTELFLEDFRKSDDLLHQAIEQVDSFALLQPLYNQLDRIDPELPEKNIQQILLHEKSVSFVRIYLIE